MGERSAVSTLSAEETSALSSGSLGPLRLPSLPRFTIDEWVRRPVDSSSAWHRAADLLATQVDATREEGITASNGQRWGNAGGACFHEVFPVHLSLLPITSMICAETRKMSIGLPQAASRGLAAMDGGFGPAKGGSPTSPPRHLSRSEAHLSLAAGRSRPGGCVPAAQSHASGLGSSVGRLRLRGRRLRPQSRRGKRHTKRRA